MIKGDIWIWFIGSVSIFAECWPQALLTWSPIHYWRPRLCRVLLLEATALPSVFTLGKEPFALGKGFAECSTRQSPLGKIFLGKWSLPSAFYRDTRQNKKQFCRVLGAALGKIFSAVARRPLTVILPSARPSTRQKKIIFFKNYFAECPSPGTRQSFFLFFLKSTLPSAPAQALGKVFF